MKKKRTLKVAAALLVLTLTATAATSCGNRNETADGDNVVIQVGYWPSQETNPSSYALHEKYLERMSEKYPNITVVPNEFDYGAGDAFLPAAASGQLPNVYRVPYTEVSKIVDAGYARDISQWYKSYGYEDALKEDLSDMVKIDGKYYGVPYQAYIVGMMYNIKLFEEAGLLDEDGKPIYPTNFEELKDIAVQIKEKTGKAAFAFPTVGAEGGWMFMSMAWSFGVDFMEQIDGKWKATFDSPEMINVLQYISDLKWKYNVLSDDLLLKSADMYQLFASDQVAFMYAPGDWPSGIVSSYGVDYNNISLSPVPTGDGGACSQLGGAIWMVSPETTDEQVDAIFKWLDVRGLGVTLDEASVERTKDNYRINNEKGLPISVSDFSVYKEGEAMEQRNEIKAPFINVNETTWNTMWADNITLKAEEPVEAQQLYQALAPALQEVLMNKDADIPALVKETNDNFQKDFLDKLK